jgi:hypothetical protein
MEAVDRQQADKIIDKILYIIEPSKKPGKKATT